MSGKESDLRIGIIGTGRIVYRFVSECNEVSGIRITTVYNPHEGSAERFVKTVWKDAGSDLPRAVSDIEVLWREVDAVYIASPHETHYDYIMQALEHEKHVLCEKPMVLEKAQAEEAYDIAAKNGIILMEGVKTAFCPAFNEICSVVSSGRIGRVVDVLASFSKLTPTNVREFEESATGGSFTEIGSYVLLPVLRLLGCDPSEIRFDAFTLPNGTDGFCRASLKYESGAYGNCRTGLTAKTEGELIITGTKGYIYVPAPWWLTSHFEVRGEDPNAKEIHDGEFLGPGLRYEIKVFMEAVMGKGASCDMDLLMLESVTRAGIMEKFLKERNSIGNAGCGTGTDTIGIWGHRGASFAHPENTIPAFIAAAEIPGIRGIEMDIQLSKDGHIVVFHDETLDRVVDGHSGFLRDHTLTELQDMRMKGSDDESARIPELGDFLDTMKPYCEKNGLMINVELKTSVYRYEGIEKKAYEMVRERGMLEHIIWSSFLADSIRIIKEIDPSARTGMLGGQMGDIMNAGDAVSCDAYHPYDGGFGDISIQDMKAISEKGMPVRAWTGSEPLFVDKDSKRMLAYDRRKLAEWGVTDIFTNVPERYLKDSK